LEKDTASEFEKVGARCWERNKAPGRPVAEANCCNQLITQLGEGKDPKGRNRRELQQLPAALPFQFAVFHFLDYCLVVRRP